MAKNSKILKVCEDWIVELADDLKEAVDKLTTHAGGQTSDLSGSVSPKATILSNGNIEIQLTINKYWEVIEDGRRPNLKPPPTKPLDQWIRQKNIPVNKYLITIRRNNLKNKRGLSISKERAAKSLSYDDKVRRLSWMMSRSIGKKGVKPRPFFHQIYNQQKVEQLKDRLTPIIKEEFVIELKEID
jgi:hypothetical protein